MKRFSKYYPQIIVILLVVLCGLIFVVQRRRLDSTNYLAQNGILSLKTWNWSENPVVALNGEWEFYPNLLSQNLSQEKPIVKAVPHFWEYDAGLNFSPYGFGTYRLQVTGLSPSGIYGLQILDEVTAYRLYVNHDVIAENGVTGTMKTTYSPQWHPIQTAFTADEHGNAEFIMEISNFDYYRGGFWNTIKIGKLENIITQANGEKLLDMFLATSMLVIGSLNLFLFFLYRKQGNTALYFTLFCFCMSARTLLTGQRLVADIFPELDWYFLVRMEYLLGYLMLPLFGLFAINLFADYPHKKLLHKFFLIIAAVCTFFTLFLSNSVYTVFLTPYKWAAMLYVINFIYSMFKVNIGNKQETVLILIAAIGLFVAVLKEITLGGTVSWLPFAALNAIICFSLISFHEFLYFIQKNEVLGMRAFLDPLTGLFNRAYLMEMEMNDQSFQQNKDKYFMFLDLDSFKSINDTFGHKVGDFVLQETGHRIKSLLKNTDIVCRYGGDEFIVVVEDCKNNVKVIAKRILQKIQEPFCQDGKNYHISVSIGIAEVTADSPDLETVIRNSDHAMYEAKRNGRNQYFFWEKREKAPILNK